MAGYAVTRSAGCAVAGALALFALATASGGASAQSCLFVTSNVVAASFGTLDPSLASTRTAFTTVRILCLPLNTSPMWLFAGANGSAPPRMRHASQPEFVPYSVSAAYLGNTGLTQNWRITATVLGADYENASPGAYADQLTATILP